MTHDFKEKRRHPRIEKNITLKIQDEPFDIVTETKNISCSGAYCKVNKFMAPMTKVAVTLLLPLVESNSKLVTKKVKCSGVVVRSEPNIPSSSSNEYKIAIFFNDIAKNDLEKISAYINYHLEKNQTMNQN